MTKRTTAAMAATLLFVALPALAGEPGTSDWAKGSSSAVRLLDGGPGFRKGVREAGVEIRLDAGFKTYWRTPGEAGVPPLLDWSGSSNVASVDVSWPAPVRFEEAGLFSIGYDSDLIVPVTVQAKDPAKPVDLDLSITYAVCSKICIPADGKVRLLLEAPALSTPVAQRIAAARDRVPEQGKAGIASPPGIVAVASAGDGEALLVDAAVPAGSTPDLFVEGPDGWLFGAPASAAAADGQGPDGTVRWRVPVLSRPDKAAKLGGLSVVLTLVAGESAVEVPAQVVVAGGPG
jgi:DsbC/DsbD-like thiol-disulfide interchange protein